MSTGSCSRCRRPPGPSGRADLAAAGPRRRNGDRLGGDDDTKPGELRVLGLAAVREWITVRGPEPGPVLPVQLDTKLVTRGGGAIPTAVSSSRCAWVRAVVCCTRPAGPARATRCSRLRFPAFSEALMFPHFGGVAWQPRHAHDPEQRSAWLGGIHRSSGAGCWTSSPPEDLWPRSQRPRRQRSDDLQLASPRPDRPR